MYDACPTLLLPLPSGNAKLPTENDLELPVQGVTVANTRRTPERTSPLYLWLAALLRDQIEAGHPARMARCRRSAC